VTADDPLSIENAQHKYMRALHGFEEINNRISLQCCLRLKPILEHRYNEDIEKYEDPNDYNFGSEED